MQIASLLTPPGVGAIGVVVVDGAGSAQILERLFEPASGISPVQFDLERVWFGRWSTGEELVVCRTGETRYEIHCHGGRLASRTVLESLAACGVVEVPWEDWITRCESRSWLRAEARRLLAAAPTERVAAILLHQAEGVLDDALGSILIAIDSGERSRALCEVRALRRLERVGTWLERPARVVLGGAPNVGKSTLLNALLGYSRAIVHDQPGTTRDIVTGTTAIAGWPVELADTAGLRDSAGLERQGAELARERLASADLVLWVVEATRQRGDESAEAAGQAEHCGSEQRAPADGQSEWLRVLNKVDLLSPTRGASKAADWSKDCPESPQVAPADGVRRARPPAGQVAVSGRTGEGLERLLEEIARRLAPAEPLPGEAAPFTATIRRVLEVAESHLVAGELVAAGQALRSAIAPAKR